ncbi:MAG: T9SS type A sorting domain-containing protein [Flavobacteriales bacterium]|nr:T9SS type A sorting domain-containing protein [Flavobacteriales bacterium]
MKKIYSTFCAMLAAGTMLTATAQQQPNNGDFENWDGNGDPTNWNDMRTGDFTGCGLCSLGSSQRIFQDNSVVHSGSASVRIESTSALSNVINGTMTTGRVVAPSTTPSQGYAQTRRNETGFNHPFTDMPDSLVFYAQYNVTNSSDSASVAVILHDDNDHRTPGGNNSQVIATAEKKFQTAGTGTWKRISVPFSYTGGSANGVAYALMTFTSSYTPGQGSSTAKLWVDDFEFIYNPIDPTSVEELASSVSVYPNPTNDGRVTISLGSEFRNGNATIVNLMGQTVGMFNFSNANNVQVAIDQPAGMYFVNINTLDGQTTTVRVIKN